MTIGEFRAMYAHLPDDTPITVCLSDGERDYAILSWEDEDDEGKIVVVSGN